MRRVARKPLKLVPRPDEPNRLHSRSRLLRLLAVESAFFARDVNAALLNILVDEICCVWKEDGVAVRTLAPSTVRKRLCGNRSATKRQVADAVAARYPELEIHLSQDSSTDARYYGKMFDAVAVGLVAARSSWMIGGGGDADRFSRVSE